MGLRLSKNIDATGHASRWTIRLDAASLAKKFVIEK